MYIYINTHTHTNIHIYIYVIYTIFNIHYFNEFLQVGEAQWVATVALGLLYEQNNGMA